MRYAENIGGLDVGDVGFLVTRNHLTKGWERTDILRRPGRTNLSGEDTLDGYLGTTNDVYEVARGAGRVTCITKSGRVRVRRLDGAELSEALESLGYPELTPDAAPVH